MTNQHLTTNTRTVIVRFSGCDREMEFNTLFEATAYCARNKVTGHLEANGGRIFYKRGDMVKGVGA
jgi:hypothetical protein